MFNCSRHPLRNCVKRSIVEMHVADSGGGAAVSEQAPGDVEVVAVHDRMRGMGVVQVVKPCVRHDAGQVASLRPEFIGAPSVNGLSPFAPGKTHSPEVESERPSSSFRAASPSRTWLGPVLASIRARRSGLTSRHRGRCISLGLRPVIRISRAAAMRRDHSPSRCFSIAPSFARSPVRSSGPRRGRW